MRAAALPSPLLAVPNVTAHSSTASVSVTVLLYDGPLLCGFNVATKGLSTASKKGALRDVCSFIRLSVATTGVPDISSLGKNSRALNLCQTRSLWHKIRL